MPMPWFVNLLAKFELIALYALIDPINVKTLFHILVYEIPFLMHL